MDNNFEQGFDEELGTEGTAPSPVIDITQEKPKRLPFAVWTVGKQDYKLKLRASEICKLEQKFRANLLMVITEDGLPPVATMLTVIQAAMVAYHHGMTYTAVQNIFDQYVDEGGDQTKLMTDVVMPLMSVSGFFTQTQAKVLEEEMKNMDSVL